MADDPDLALFPLAAPARPAVGQLSGSVVAHADALTGGTARPGEDMAVVRPLTMLAATTQNGQMATGPPTRGKGPDP